MNEEEKKIIELDIEAKYVDKTEKEFLSRLTYEECLYILTPENEYRDKIIKLSILKICEIIEKLQKENEELKEIYRSEKKMKNEYVKLYQDLLLKENVIPIQKIKDKIEKYKNMCISNVKGYENYFKDNYNELVFRRMEQLEKELLESEE